MINWKTRGVTKRRQNHSLLDERHCSCYSLQFEYIQMRQKQHTWACSAYHSWALWAVCRRTLSPSVRPGHTRHTGARGPRSTCEAEALFYCSTCHRNTSHTFGSDAKHERTFIDLGRELGGNDLIMFQVWNNLRDRQKKLTAAVADRNLWRLDTKDWVQNEWTAAL